MSERGPVAGWAEELERPAAAAPGGGWFDALAERFAAAASAAGGRPAHRYAIAGDRVEVVLAGDALAPVLLPALAHLEVPAREAAADLTVLAFDSTSTGVEPPAPPAAGQTGETGDDPAVVRVLQRGAGLFSALDRGRGLAVVWTRDARRVPWNEVAAPLRMVLQPWFAARGWQLVHGAAVGTAEGGALIAGRSGAGKSTTALACLAAGLGFAGDDYVLATADPEPWVHGVYASAKLQEEQLPRFPRLAPRVANPVREPGEKPVLLLAGDARLRLVPSMPLRAVVVPRVTGAARPAVRPIAPAEALAALAPSTLFQLPFDRPAALGRLRRLVESCPCWRLEAGPDLPAVAAAVAGLLAEAR